MITHSTGRLSEEQRRQQDETYAAHPTYDVVVIGSGMAGLTVAALLAHAGRRVAVLEAHDLPGGYVHSFRMGDYRFCAQIHYIWGCGPGERVTRLLEKLGLQNEVTFEPLDPAGYDHVILPNRRRVRIPCGYEELARNVEEACPGQGPRVREFTAILDRLTEEVGRLPERISWWQYLTQGWHFRTLLRYHRKTLQEVFDECRLSREAQAILSANSGNYMCPPRDLSILAYNGLFSGYNRGAWYPRKHFRHLVDELAKAVTRQPGCHIYYEHEVTGFEWDGSRLAGVRTQDGKVFRAPEIICNADPQATAGLIGWDRFPAEARKALRYDYSGTALTIYLGVRGLDLRDYGFGRHNTWHLEQWDLNQTWDEAMHHDWTRPWVFLATPTLHTPEGGQCPEGSQILELATAADYGYFRELKDHDLRAYNRQKLALKNRLLDIVEAHHVPGLRNHLELQVVGSPTTNEDYCRAPRGHAYGQSLTPANMGRERLKAATPWENFHWCNAASGYPGVNGTIGTGLRLYMELTGDRFWDGL